MRQFQRRGGFQRPQHRGRAPLMDYPNRAPERISMKKNVMPIQRHDSVNAGFTRRGQGLFPEAVRGPGQDFQTFDFRNDSRIHGLRQHKIDGVDFPNM